MKISIKDRFDIFLFGTGYKQDFREEKKTWKLNDFQQLSSLKLWFLEKVEPTLHLVGFL